VVGVSRGRASGGDSKSSSGGAPARRRRQEGRRHHQASDSSFWQTMLAGARRAAPTTAPGRLFGPTSETDVNQQVQLIENSISRGADAIVLAPNSSDALNNAIKRARDGGTKVVVVDTAVTTDAEGFIGTDNVKAGEQAGKTLCELATKAASRPAAC